MSETAMLVTHKPCWLDLSSPDLEASKKFYTQLFGWEAVPIAGPEAGNYTFFKMNGKDVAGMGSLMDKDQPPVWLTYILSSDVDKAAMTIRAAGGELVMEPMDVMQAGRMCILRDPTGAHLGLWQAGEHKGMGVMGEPGSFTWTELQTGNMQEAQKFYQAVFEWKSDTHPMGDSMPDYTEWKVDGEPVAGGMEMPKDMSAQMPPFWLPYFGVEDVERSTAMVKDLGGKVMVGPKPYPGGMFALVTDPHGVAFGLTQSRV